jgi:RNA polymerase primary sigma factor
MTDDERAQLIEANQRLVEWIAGHYEGRGVNHPEHIRAGNSGLAPAAAKFDETRGYKFATWATWWIRQAITRAIADQGRLTGGSAG